MYVRVSVCVCDGYHSYSVTGQKGRHVQNHIVGHVGQQVDDSHHRHGDGDGQRQVPQRAVEDTVNFVGFLTIFNLRKTDLLGLSWKEQPQQAAGTPAAFASLPLWVLNLLCDKIQGVPAGVGEQS